VRRIENTKERLFELLQKKELMLLWRIKCSDMFNVPLLLLKEMEDDVKDE